MLHMSVYTNRDLGKAALPIPIFTECAGGSMGAVASMGAVSIDRHV